ncbi:MAG: hypothetical protein COB89_03915 [Piscirickettsiaceae bacterium]|nr:MAG: hypothetical protein COB89_07870 [Piscirickettsiaceae bacterium]PCH84914.1 MAG: hypothetical protein COB89_03915 [Piscirickettsiaceae bacterium]
MNINWKKFNRKTHYWGAIICAIPLLIVIGTGVLLLLKKDFEWIQPSTIRGSGEIPHISFEQILNAAKTVGEAGIKDWSDIDRLDVRPSKGIVKVRAKNQWEIQIDHQTLKVLQVAYRRSDFIESIHDGTFFHDAAKLWLFLPCAVILFALWVTGLYMFLTTHFAKRRSKKKRQKLNAS